jgi:hypothetical protein
VPQTWYGWEKNSTQRIHLRSLVYLSAIAFAISIAIASPWETLCPRLGMAGTKK